MLRMICRAALIAAVVVLQSGCADVAQTMAAADAVRHEAAAARDRLAADLAGLERSRDALPPDAPAPDLDAAIAGVRARVAALDAAVLHADRVLAEMAEPADGLTRLVGAAGPWLPDPVRGPALLGAALLATLLRARQVRKGAGSIVASIQNALKDPDFRAAFDRHADAIRSIQTPTARRIVDEVTRPGPMLRSPI